MIKTFRLRNLDCANCAIKIEQAVKKIKTVNSISVNYIMQKMTIDIDSDYDNTLQQVIKVCHKIEPECEILLSI